MNVGIHVTPRNWTCSLLWWVSYVSGDNKLGLSNNSTVKYLPGTSFTAVKCIFGTLHCCKIHPRVENYIHSHTAPVVYHWRCACHGVRSKCVVCVSGTIATASTAWYYKLPRHLTCCWEMDANFLPSEPGKKTFLPFILYCLVERDPCIDLS